MSKELFLKYANSSQYNKKKCYALKSWCDKQNNVFPLLEVFDCLYNAANGNRDELTKLIEQLTAKDKTFGRSSTVFGVDNPHMYIIRNEEGDLEIRGYNPNFSGNPIGQHQAHEPSVIRKDGQMKKNVIKSREKLVDLGQEVRKIYQGQSNELLTCAIRAIKKFASEHKISEMTVVDRIKKGVYMLDTSEGLDNGKIVSKMKSIKLTESQINEIAEVTKLTEYKFYNNVQRFLSDLLRDPVNAKVPFLLQANNITRNQLLYYLKSLDIIKRHEKIKDRDSQGNPITAKMVVRYSVPKKDFTKKMKKLYISLVAKNVPNKKEKVLDECDGGAAPACGTADCSGQYSQPLFGVQRRKMPNEIDETTTASNVAPNGDTSMGITVPFASDEETRDRTPGFSVERQDESDEKAFGESFCSAAVYIFCKNEEGKICVLAGKRNGYGGGLLNVPVGMREDFDKTIADTAIREVKEETGLSLDKIYLNFINGEKWGEGKIGANFRVHLSGNITKYTVGEGDGENERFQWIPLDEIGNYDWAFGMENTIMQIYQGKSTPTHMNEGIKYRYRVPTTELGYYDLHGYVIAEGVIKSYNANWVVKKLSSMFNLIQYNDWKVYEDGYKNAYGSYEIISSENNDGKLNNDEACIEIILPQNIAVVRSIEKFCNVCGWNLVNQCDFNLIPEYKMYAFQKEHYEKEDELKLRKEYYHLTPMRKVNKIMKQGLCPKSGNKLGTYPSRVYLFPDISRIDISRIADDLENPLGRFNDINPRKEPYAVLRIDTSKCPNIKVYGDVDFYGAVFTYDNIPPQAINVEGVVERTNLNESIDEMNVFHASKANFNKFNHRKNLGSGAGSQVFGYGSYFTNDDAVAQGYIDSFKSPHLTEEELDAIKEECRNGLSEVDTATLDLFEDLGDVWTASDAKGIISKAKGLLEEVDDCVKRVKTNFEVFAHQWCSYHMDNWNIVLYNQIIAPLHFILKHDWNENDVKIVLIQRNNETVPISEITNEEYKSLCDYIIGLFESSQRISQRIIELIQNSNYFKERKAYKYNVNIPDEGNDNYLDWYKPLSENAYSRIVNGMDMLCKKWKNQTKLFQLKGTFVDDRNIIMEQNFGKIYQQISRWLGNQKMFSMILQYCGFDGIKYEAGTKWGKPDGSREDGYNYVLFDANKAKINNVKEYEE